MDSFKPHILIVDDDNRILKLLKQFLCKNDFLVSTANSVLEAEILLKSFVFDLIILDIMFLIKENFNLSISFLLHLRTIVTDINILAIPLKR